MPERRKPLPGRGEQSPDITQHLSPGSGLGPEWGRALGVRQQWIERSPWAGDPAPAASWAATQTPTEGCRGLSWPPPALLFPHGCVGLGPPGPTPLSQRGPAPKGGCRQGRRSQPPQGNAGHPPQVSCMHQDKNSPFNWFGFSSVRLFWLCITQIKRKKNQELKSSFPLVSQYTEPCPSLAGGLPQPPKPSSQGWWPTQQHRCHLVATAESTAELWEPLSSGSLPAPAGTAPGPNPVPQGPCPHTAAHTGHSTHKLSGALRAGEGPYAPLRSLPGRRKKNKYREKIQKSLLQTTTIIY